MKPNRSAHIRTPNHTNFFYLQTLCFTSHVGNKKANVKNNFFRSSKVNRIIASLSLCGCMSLMQLCSRVALHFDATLLSSSAYIQCFHKGMREAEWHTTQRHIRGVSSPSPPPLSLSSSLPSLFCRAEPALLPQLLLKPGCSLRGRLVFWSSSIAPSLFSFFADVNRVASQSSLPSSLSSQSTPHLENHKKEEKNEQRVAAQKQEGDNCASAFPPAPSASRKTYFQSFPPVPLAMQRLHLVVGMASALMQTN